MKSIINVLKQGSVSIIGILLIVVIFGLIFIGLPLFIVLVISFISSVFFHVALSGAVKLFIFVVLFSFVLFKC